MHQMISASFTEHLWMIICMMLKFASALQEGAGSVWRKLLLKELK